VIPGVEARESAPHWEPIFQVSTVKKRMYMFKTFTVENTLGWACLISTLKGRLFGAMEHRLTFITGQRTSQTTFVMKIASILSGPFEITSTNGTMSIVQTVTGSLARKVRRGEVLVIFIMNGPRIAGMCGRLKLINKFFEPLSSRLLPQCAHAWVFLKVDWGNPTCSLWFDSVIEQ